MPGFYTNHLKSERSRLLATFIEDAFEKAATKDGKKTSIEFDILGPNETKNVLYAGYATLRDHPEFFYYKTNLSAFCINNKVTLTTKLLYSKNEIQAYKAALDAETKRITASINPLWTLWDKEKFIFDYLQSTVTYTDDGKNERHSIIGALLEHRAVCEGISKAFAVLCHSVGIQCIVVFSKTHMWNVVNINGTLCNVDATYGTKGELGVNYTFFNTSDKYLQEEHKKVLGCIPPCKNDSQEYYSHMGTFFNEEKDLRKYLLKNLFFSRRTIQAKLKNGSIEKVIKSVSALIPYSLEYSVNSFANTAIIKVT